MQTRRSFLQRCTMLVGALTVSGSTLFLSGCNVAQDIITAFQSILALLAGAGVIPAGPIVNAVNAALQQVLDDITAYQNAPAADKTTFGQRLSLAIQIAEANLQTFWNSLGLVGKLGSVVEGLIAIILSTLTGVLPSLPVPPTAPAEAMAAKRLSKKIIYVAKKRSSHEFRSDFNKELTTNGYPKTAF